MDFFEAVDVRRERPTRIEIYPEFFVDNSEDLMIRGGDFYAVWDEKKQIWSRDIKLIREAIDVALSERLAIVEEREKNSGIKIVVKKARSNSSGSWREFLGYISRLPDSYHQLDTKLTFADTVVSKKDYVSKRLPYSMRDGDISAYEELVSTLYSPEERAKFEWAIGSVLAGESKKIQKFIVFHGPMGTGKSTIMNLIEKLFGGYIDDNGYCAKINAQALVGGNPGFALEPFGKSPLVGIDQDSKLSKIEDNTLLNQIVSHDKLQINEKFKNLYASSVECFLFMGTNEPVKITNSKSGIIRRLIDVEPTGNIVTPESRYDRLVEKLDYELGAIAKHCLDVYKRMGRTYYSNYIPKRMMLRTDPFFNFMLDKLEVFQKNGMATADEIWSMYKTWCDDSGMDFRLKRFQVIDEAKNYFENFEERTYVGGKQFRNVYSGIKTKKFVSELKDYRKQTSDPNIPAWLEMRKQISIFDKVISDCKAQYGDDKPKLYWADVTTKLKDIDTQQTHYVQVPHNLITLDFDKKNAAGEKDFKLNVEAASKYPETYAELSKGGNGIHLEYWYDGNSDDLSPFIEEGIEVKVMTGNAALRRRLSKCNNYPIAHISSGLPLRKKKVVNSDVLENEKHLRALVLKALKKEIEPYATRTSMDFIAKVLSEAQEQGISYDFSQLDNAIFSFAANSTHQKDYCLKVYSDLKLRWPEEVKNDVADIGNPSGAAVISSFKSEAPIVFFDVEVFPNVNIIVYKEIGKEKECVRLINPTPNDIEQLLKMRLVGFNNRSYDNHILWAIYIGYTPAQVYQLSQEIIVAGNRSPFRDAPNLSYTDVYDYASEKKSLKKWEIALGEPHVELDWPWDKDIPEDMWDVAARYCENDVRATEAVWNATQADFKAREILAEITGMTVNDTTNQLSTRFIFGDVREPWHQFNYPDLKAKFPEYRFEHGKSYYGDVLIGEGGRVYAQPGMYHNVKTFDVASMHPSSIIAENGFGPFTKRFKELMDIRIAIKHKDFDKARSMLDGKLAPYLTDPTQAKQLSFALKIVINSVYGLTAAKFQNKFKDPRNVDNWVAKRGALFMETLRRNVQAMGATVVHIKTDSIKVADPTPEIENYILSYGKEWGYTFEIESIYDRICLVNDAVYIARCSDDPENGEEAGHWTATGAQFQHPYVFKALFSKEPLTFDDRCEVRTVNTAMYLDMNEQKPDISKEEKELEKCEKALKKLWGGGSDWELIQEFESAKYPQEVISQNNEIVHRMVILRDQIAKGHDYHFIGKAGLFCPILPGYGGGELMRKANNGSYGAVSGTKGYRWLESEEVKRLHYEKYIDEGYFKALADQAIETISVYGPFDVFVSDDAFSNAKSALMRVDRPKLTVTISSEDLSQLTNDDLPWYPVPCGSSEYAMCCDCPHFYDEQEYCCKLGYNIKNQIITD